MQNIKDLLLDRLLNKWLSKWKENAPSRFVDKWGDGVPEYWCNGLEEKVSDDWLNQLRDTRSAIQKLTREDCLIQLLETHSVLSREKRHELINKFKLRREKYHELARDIKNKYDWVGSMNAGKIWDAHSDEGEEQQTAKYWRDFLSQVIEILLAKTHCQHDDSDLDLLYRYVRLKIEALVDSLIPNVYKAELHGRRQPQSWEDFLQLAIELLLAGKREWNKNKYPDISEQISKKKEGVVASLVSAAYKQHLFVKALYSDWAHKWRFLSSQQEDNDDDEENVEYTPSELNKIAEQVKDEQVENLVGKGPNLDYISEFNLGDDEELRWFANRLPEFIEVKNPYKHRINVVLQPNCQIAKGLGLPTKKVRELKRRLRTKLQPYREALD
jgi:hypothetical protein